MNIWPNPNRVALQETVPQNAVPAETKPPRLWASLPMETQRQLARSFARLLLGMRSPLLLAKADRHADGADRG